MQTIEPLRAQNANKETHKHFYELVGNKNKELHLENKPQNIFNCDETGFLCHRGSQKVFVRKNECSRIITSNNDKQLYPVNVSKNILLEKSFKI